MAEYTFGNDPLFNEDAYEDVYEDEKDIFGGDEFGGDGDVFGGEDMFGDGDSDGEDDSDGDFEFDDEEINEDDELKVSDGPVEYDFSRISNGGLNTTYMNSLFKNNDMQKISSYIGKMYSDPKEAAIALFTNYSGFVSNILTSLRSSMPFANKSIESIPNFEYLNPYMLVLGLATLKWTGSKFQINNDLFRMATEQARKTNPGFKDEDIIRYIRVWLKVQ